MKSFRILLLTLIMIPAFAMEQDSDFDADVGLSQSKEIEESIFSKTRKAVAKHKLEVNIGELALITTVAFGLSWLSWLPFSWLQECSACYEDLLQYSITPDAFERLQETCGIVCAHVMVPF